jgi:hypothetical protein
MRKRHLTVLAAAIALSTSGIAIGLGVSAGTVGAALRPPSALYGAGGIKPAHSSGARNNTLSGQYTLYYISYSGSDNQCEVFNLSRGVMTGDKGDVGKYSKSVTIKWTTAEFLAVGPFKGKLDTSGGLGSGYYGSEPEPKSVWDGAAFGPVIFESGDDPIGLGGC